MEKFQYGQRLEFEVLETLHDIKTEKAHIKFVKTSNHGNVLLMDDEVQLSTQDEYRYHEKLVHPVMSNVCVKPTFDVLILGGGDGCAAREVLKWWNVNKIDVVDYDSEFVEKIGKSILNKNVYSNPKVTYNCKDAIDFLNETENLYDAIFIDFPDPDNEAFVDLYVETIKKCKTVLHPDGVLSMHVGPALLDQTHIQWERIRLFRKTLLSTFENRNPTIGYSSCYVPSFSNEWAFLYLFLNNKNQKNHPTVAFYIEQVKLGCKYWTNELGSNTSRDLSPMFTSMTTSLSSASTGHSSGVCTGELHA
jgi:spermidine synthase